MSKKLLAPLAIVAALTLAACGGNPPAEPAPPADAAPADAPATEPATPPAN